MKIKLIEDIKHYLFKLLLADLYPNIEIVYQKNYSSQLYDQKRRCGNTTRLIDTFVQNFFNRGECRVFDHYPTRQSKERVFDLVLDRLKREHHVEDILLDRNKLIIRKKK